LSYHLFAFFAFFLALSASDNAIATACFWLLPAFISALILALIVLSEYPFFNGISFAASNHLSELYGMNSNSTWQTWHLFNVGLTGSIAYEAQIGHDIMASASVCNIFAYWIALSNNMSACFADVASTSISPIRIFAIEHPSSIK
jgi:hypothetical protein